MLWYEFASTDEVKEVLEKLLHTYGFVKSQFHWVENVRGQDGGADLNYIFPSQAYEIAEALWGEYSEEE